MGESLEARAFQLLGGSAVFRRPVCTSLDADEVIASGFPSQALAHLVDEVGVLASGDTFDKVIGTSLRTFRRKREKDRLTREQGGRAWRFARILAHATEVLGGQKSAEMWLLAPARGLDNRRPVDLLVSSAGARAVEKHLTRIEYGVYA